MLILSLSLVFIFPPANLTLQLFIYVACTVRECSWWSPSAGLATGWRGRRRAARPALWARHLAPSAAILFGRNRFCGHGTPRCIVPTTNKRKQIWLMSIDVEHTTFVAWHMYMTYIQIKERSEGSVFCRDAPSLKSESSWWPDCSQGRAPVPGPWSRCCPTLPPAPPAHFPPGCSVLCSLKRSL